MNRHHTAFREMRISEDCLWLRLQRLELQRIERVDLQLDFERGFNSLSRDQRVALVLRDSYGFDFKEIAFATGVSDQTVGRRYWSAKGTMYRLRAPGAPGPVLLRPSQPKTRCPGSPMPKGVRLVH